MSLLIAMWRLLAGLFVLGFTFQVSYANTLSASGHGENLLLQSFVYTDTTNQVTLDQIIAPASLIVFQQADDLYQKINNNNTFWFKIVIPATSDASEKWLQIDPAWLDHVNLYQINADGTYSQQLSGKNADVKDKLFPYRFPLFKVDIKPNQPTVLYLQQQSRIGQLLSARLWTPSLFMNHEANAQLGWGIFFGVCFLLIIASWWFEVVIRDGVYGTFSLYVLSYAVLNLAATGWWYEWLYQLFGIFFFPIITLSLVWLQYISIRFFLKFTGIDVARPRIYYRVMTTLLVYGVLMSIGMFTNEESFFIQIHYAVSILFFLPVILLLIYKEMWRSQDSLRNVFILITSVVLISSLVSIMSLLHILPYNDYISTTPTVSNLFLFILIFYTLSKRYKKLSDERDLATRRLLEVTQNSEQTLKHLVDLKTKDLSDAKIKIEKSLYAERQSYQEQRNFISMVSHEFRTPLAIIDATLQNLIVSSEATTLQSKLQKIYRSTERLTALMTNYLSQDRLDIFLQGVNASWFDVLPVIKDEKKVAESLALDHVFSVNGAGDTLIYTDKDILKLVLHTLLENAMKYTPVGTYVQIIFHRSTAYWMIDVSDNGPGIGDEAELIFEKFYRGRTASNKVGTGLGLTLSRNLLRLQGGELSLVNMKDKTGCCFRISIPIIKQQPDNKLSS